MKKMALIVMLIAGAFAQTISMQCKYEGTVDLATNKIVSVPSIDNKLKGKILGARIIDWETIYLVGSVNTNCPVYKHQREQGSFKCEGDIYIAVTPGPSGNPHERVIFMMTPGDRAAPVFHCLSEEKE